MKCNIHSTIFQCPKFPSPKWHTSIPVTEPKFGLWNNLRYIERSNFQFCCIPKSQITPPEVTHLNNNYRTKIWSITYLYVTQTAAILSPDLGTVIKGPWRKLKESEKITKISEQPLQYCTVYKVPKHPTQKETPQD